MIFIDIKGVIDSEQSRVMMEMLGAPSQICSVENVRKALNQNPDESEVMLNIDCDGGSVEEGLKIYDELRISGKTIFTNIVGGCHSMAVVLLLAAPAENRSANRNIRALIHRVYAPTCDWLTADDCLDIAEMCLLEKVMRQERVHDAKSLLKLNFISKINTYNTNQLINQFKIMAKNEQSAYDKFIGKVRDFKNRYAPPKPANYDYKDAEGEVVFSTDAEEDTLAVGDTVTIASGETSGTFLLDDGREVTIEDSVVSDIQEAGTEDLEGRITELEQLLEEATNLIGEQQTTINKQDEELKNLRGSNYTPKNRKPFIPGSKSGKSGADNRSTEDIKAASRETREKFRNAGQIKK